MSPKLESVMAYIDAIDRDLAHLSLKVASNGHAPLYAEDVADLRLLQAGLRNLLDDRATGEFPRLRRDTPRDDEEPTPPEPSRPIIERRRNRTRNGGGDDER